MRGPIFLPLTCVLAVVTGVALLGAADAVTGPAVEPSTNERNKAIVRSFYDAVNDVIRFGDPTLLAPVTADTFVARRSSAVDGWSRDEFGRYLADLRAETPGLRFAVEDLMADRDRVVARIRLVGVGRGDWLSAPSELGMGWGATDILRVEDGKIVEYGGASAELGSARPLWSLVFDVAHAGPAFVGLARVSLEPDARIPILVSPGPTIYGVEVGALTIRIDGVGLVTRADSAVAEWTTQATAGGRLVRLGPGDRIAIRPGVSYTLSAAPGTGAVALAASVMPLGALDPPEFVNAGITPSVPIGVAMFVLVPDWSPAPWPAGVEVRPLVGGALPALPASSVAVSFQQVALSPGTLVRDHQADGSVLVGVESGSVLLAWSARQDANSLAGAATLEGAGDAGRTDEIEVLTAGTTGVLAPGEIVSVRNVGEAPCTIVVASVEPAEIGDWR